MEIEFTIPLNRQELTSHQHDGYYVQEIHEPIHIDEKLEDCGAEYREEGPIAIFKAFDTFYSVLHHVGRLKKELVESAWELLLTNFNAHVSALPMILDPEGIDSQLRKQQLNALKMESYILTQFIDAFENDAAKPGVELSVGKKGKSSKKKPQKEFDWSVERVTVLHAINQLMQLEIQRLWDPPIVEEEFTNLFSSVCYKMLENQAFARQKDDRDLVFQILGQLIKRFNHRLGASLKIIQLLQHFEHLVSPLAQALEIFVNTYGAKTLVGDVIREIGQMDSLELSRDTSGTKSFSQFIVEIAEKIPSCVLPNISLLMAHLDGDSYTMRNGVLGVFGEIVVKVLSKEDLDENMKKSRESFLDKLEDHLHDVNAFVRSKVVQIWLHLTQEKVVPILRQKSVVDLIIGRLNDKSCNVRKYAVQFLKTSLIGNPFGAKLSMEQLSSSLEKEAAKLAEMEPNEQMVEAPPLEPLCEGWLEIRESLRTAIKDSVMDEAMEESNEDLDLYDGDEDALDKVLLQIQKDLKKEEFSKAIRLLSLAMENWSDLHDFQVNKKELEELSKQMETNDDNEDIDEEANEEDGSSSKSSQGSASTDSSDEDAQKKKQMLKYEVLLQKIYQMKENEEKESLDSVFGKAAEPQQPEELMLNKELENQRIVVGYLKSCLDFSQQMQRAIPVLYKLLGSKSSSDVLETIDFFIAAHEFGLSQSEEGIRKMANLVWSRDPVIKKSVVSAFERLYIDVPCDNARNKPTVIVKSFISLLAKANLGEMTSLEELICELMKMELIPPTVINLLWQKFSLKIPQTTPQEQRSSIVILSMIANAEKDIIKSNLSVLIEHGLTKQDTLFLARDTCAAILKLTGKKNSAGVDNTTEPFRLPTDHPLFSTLELMIIQELPYIDHVSWTPFCEQALMVIYHLAEAPDTICGRILKCLFRQLMGTGETENPEVGEDVEMEEDIFPKQTEEQTEEQTDAETREPDLKKHPRLVARVLFAVGHIALLHLYHLDISIFSELKRRHRIKEEEDEKKGNRKTPGTNKKIVDASASKISSKSSSQESALDDEMGVGGAVAEDAEAEYIRRLCEHEIVTGTNLLTVFTPLLVTICSSPTVYKCPELQSSATLALSKFMLVSSEFCDQHLQLLFTILEKSELTHVRSNTIIALGDLTLRFPNLIEPWTPHLYARLRDPSVDVRKTTVTILSHLILNDMVKVKGQISEMAVCLEDKSEKIASSAKMFFFELAQKGNALYNIAPDVISRLSDPDTGVEEKIFRLIMKYLLQFIQKDKQSESLVEKLCHRFRATKTDRQWRDLSYCLSVLPYNEKAFKKLQENISCYRTLLSEVDVYNNFLAILAKLRKFCKPELKTLLDDFEKILHGYHTKSLDENVDIDSAANVLTDASAQVNTNNANEPEKSKESEPVKTTARKGRRQKKKQTCDDSEDSDVCEKENRGKSVAKSASKSGDKRRNKRRVPKTVALNTIFSSDDEDMFA